MNGFGHHLWMSFRLNFRNPQAIVFGYLMPIFFLIAFGSTFEGQRNIASHLGQLLTISILGGACFGMPSTFVSERERGVWRRYKLTPMPAGWFVASLMLARFFIVLTSGVLQVVLARVIYKAPWPLHPWELLISFTFATFAFLGVGLIIAMVANSIAAVQALGQSIFLPMIMIGGVAFPLRTLPKWCQHFAAFLPSKYAVAAVDFAVLKKAGLATSGSGFCFIALTLIGAAACLAGTKLFRWENNQKLRATALAWVMVALGMWAVVGLAAEQLDLVKKL